MYYEKLKYFAKKHGKDYINSALLVPCYGVKLGELGYLYYYYDSDYITFENDLGTYLITQSDEAFKYDEGFIKVNSEDLFYLIMGYIHRYLPSLFNDVIDYKPVLVR